jgi:DNA processing protein
VEPAPWRFPARNRIIAGLCGAAVVVEARERSGALITADFALEDGREVMVVPGEITSAVSAGSNALLRLGATPVTAAADVLEAYGIELSVEPPESFGGLAGTLLECLGDNPASIDELARSSGLAPGDVAAALIELELAGRVSEGDGVYRATITR